MRQAHVLTPSSYGCGSAPGDAQKRTSESEAHNRFMGVIYFVVDLFIDTVGITRPSEKARRQAAFFILGLLALAVAGAAVAFFLLTAASSNR
jgi:hypothetical protein